MATQMQLKVILTGSRIATRVGSCEADTTTESMIRKREAEIVSVSVFSKVLSLD